jgi:hypothetical protein
VVILDNDRPPQTICVELVDYIDRQTGYIVNCVKIAEEKFDIRHQALIDEYDKSERAIAATKMDLEKRLDGMNEFREQLQKQAATFATLQTVDQKIELSQVTQRLIAAQELPAIQVQIKAIWAVLFATLSILGAVFIAHLLGKV